MWSAVRLAIFAIFLCLPIMAFAGDDSVFGFNEAGRMYKVDPVLLKALSSVESSHRQSAVNKATYDGNPDQGHMQIHSGTWKSVLGDKKWKKMLEDPRYCTYVGAWVLRHYINRFGNNENAVCGYHTGRSLNYLYAKAKTGKARDIERYNEACTYVQNVIATYKKLGGKGHERRRDHSENLRVAQGQSDGTEDQPLKRN